MIGFFGFETADVINRWLLCKSIDKQDNLRLKLCQMITYLKHGVFYEYICDKIDNRMKKANDAIENDLSYISHSPRITLSLQ